VVREIETALGLDHVGEQPDHVAVLAVELKLHLGLVLLKVLRAHELILLSFSPFVPVRTRSAASTGSTSTMSSIGSTGSIRAGPAWTATRFTFTNEYRWTADGPCSVRARSCSSVLYPLCRSNPYQG